jgi:hypothetical protein
VAQTVHSAQRGRGVRPIEFDRDESSGRELSRGASATETSSRIDRRGGRRTLQSDGGTDGNDLAREVKMRWPLLPVILISGRPRERVGELPPGVAYMPKPWAAQRSDCRRAGSKHLGVMRGVSRPARAF